MEFKKYKKYIYPAIAVFVVITLYNMVFHGILMEKFYLDNSELFKPQDEIQKNKHLLWLANLIYSFAFCYIYTKGHEKGEPIVQGIRYAIWISLLIWVPKAIIGITVYPHPKTLEFALLIGYTIQAVFAGITASLVFSKIK